MEKLATRCARYKAERDLARQELDRLRDRSRDTTMSAYDLLPEEEREAIAWVRAHGGLEGAMAMWSERARLWSELTRVALACGADGSGGEGTPEDVGSAIASALERRLMPEGMEWPRYEDGEPVRIGDVASRLGEDFEIHVICLYSDGSYALNFNVYLKGESVKRPEPKVLDAAGVEIRVGDVLYRNSDGHMVKVAEVYEKTFTDADDYVRPGDGYTHRAPVLAADGRPLREGDTVYHVKTGTEYSVRSVTNGGAHLSKGEKPSGYCRADYLTHERPDSWERLEEDARQLDIDLNDTTDDYPRMSCCRDLVRRAKALTGVSE